MAGVRQSRAPARYQRVCAIPLKRGDDVLGALALYCHSGVAVDEIEMSSRLLAAAAGVGLWHWRDRHRLRTLTEQLTTALRTRIVIEQAKGVLAGRHGISLPEAFARLRRLARNNRLPIHEVARGVTEFLTSPGECRGTARKRRFAGTAGRRS